MFPKSLMPCTLRPADSVRGGKRVRLSNILTDTKQPGASNRTLAQSPYDATGKPLTKSKRKGKSIGLSTRRVSLAENRGYGTLTPTNGASSTKAKSSKLHAQERYSQLRIRRFTRSPSPVQVPLPSKPTLKEWKRKTVFPKSVTPDLGLLSDSSEENVIQTPAEEEDGRLSPTLAYSKLLERSINSYMDLNKANKQPKSQNLLMNMPGCLLVSTDFSQLQRGSEAEPEPQTCSKRLTLGPEEPVTSPHPPVSPLVRRLRQVRPFDLPKPL